MIIKKKKSFFVPLFVNRIALGNLSDSQTLALWSSQYLLTHLINPLTVRVVGAPQIISQPVSSIFLCSPLPSGTWRTPGLSIPWCCLPHLLFCLLCLLLPFTVPCKVVLAKSEERETWSYHYSLRLFTMVRISSCGPIACWILARTSLLETWSLYETRSILR